MLCPGCGTPNRTQATRCVRCGKALAPPSSDTPLRPAPIAPSVARELKEQTNAKKPIPARPIVAVPSLSGIADKNREPMPDTTGSRSSPWSQSQAGGALRGTPPSILEDNEITSVEPALNDAPPKRPPLPPTRAQLAQQAQQAQQGQIRTEEIRRDRWKNANDTEDEQPAIGKVGFSAPRGRPPPPKPSGLPSTLPSTLPKKPLERDATDTDQLPVGELKSRVKNETQDAIDAAQRAAQQKLTRARLPANTQETLQPQKKPNALPSFPEKTTKPSPVAKSAAPTEELLANRPVAMKPQKSSDAELLTPLGPKNFFDEPPVSATRLAAPGELAGKPKVDAQRAKANEAHGSKAASETFAAPGELAGLVKNARSSAEAPPSPQSRPPPPAPIAPSEVARNARSSAEPPPSRTLPPVPRAPIPAEPSRTLPPTQAARPSANRGVNTDDLIPPSRNAPPPPQRTSPRVAAQPDPLAPPRSTAAPPTRAPQPDPPRSIPPPARTSPREMAMRNQPKNISPEQTIAAPGELAGLVEDLGIVTTKPPQAREPRRPQTSDLVAPWGSPSAPPKIDLNAHAALPGPPALDDALPMRARTEPEAKPASMNLRAETTERELDVELDADRTPPPRARTVASEDSMDEGLLSMPGSALPPADTLIPQQAAALLEGIDIMPNAITASVAEPAVAFTVPGFARRAAAELIDVAVLASIVVAPIAFGLFGKSLTGISWMDPDDVSNALIGGAMIIPAVALAVLAIVSSSLGHALAGRSLGKLVCGLELVEKKSGRRPTLLRTVIRAMVGLFGSIAFGMNYLWLIVDRRSRTLHDVLTGTIAVVSSSRREL